MGTDMVSSVVITDISRSRLAQYGQKVADRRLAMEGEKCESVEFWTSPGWGGHSVTMKPGKHDTKDFRNLGDSFVNSFIVTGDCVVNLFSEPGFEGDHIAFIETQTE